VSDATATELLAQLHGLRDELAGAMRERYDRDLPVGELLSDRWERAQRLGFGAGANIYDASYVMGDVSVGEGTWIGPFTILDALRAPITIGAQCSISAGVQIYTHDAVKRTLSGNVGDFEVAPVAIGDCTYVGSQATILHGVTIGHHCVVGAGSLVNRDLEPYTIAYGTPARVRGRVEIAPDGTIELRSF
jgi:acetyltransferase-like isoleucine patch superfamily enzyme